MSQSELRRRMRGSDAMFLYFERKEMPLHIGAVAVLDGPFDEESERLLAVRLPEVPRYRQRVVFPALGLTHPSWEYDPNFDIHNHIRRVRLEPPGTDQQLSQLSGALFTTLMDRSKPLWDMTVVDGLEGGRSALILRVHHCMVDGVSGMALVNVMFDPTREPRRVEPKPYCPPPLPEPRQVLVEGLSGFWADTAERLIGSQLTLMRIAQAFTGETSNASIRALLATMPEMLRPTERLPFNKACSGVRGHCWTMFPFGEARAIRSALGGTINDVVLTVVTGAFSRYVKAHCEPVEKRFIRMMVPVNLRGEDPRGTVGNDISMLPLSVPLDIEDPAERLRTVTMRSSAMKAARIADLVHLIGTSIGWAPPNLQQSLAAMPFMPQGPLMIVNTVCTNVPGPMVPLYSNGRQLLTYHPHVPCGSDVGMSVAVSSYNQNLSYAVTYDMQAAPDGELFRDFLIESYEELRAAAGIPPTRVAKPVDDVKAAAVAPANLRTHREAEPVPMKQAAAEPLDAPVADSVPTPAAKPASVDGATAKPAPAEPVTGRMPPEPEIPPVKKAATERPAESVPAPAAKAASVTHATAKPAPIEPVMRRIPPESHAVVPAKKAAAERPAESVPAAAAKPPHADPVIKVAPPPPAAAVKTPGPPAATVPVKHKPVNEAARPAAAAAAAASAKPATKPAAPALRTAPKPGPVTKAGSEVAIVPPRAAKASPPPEPKSKAKKAPKTKMAKATAGTR